MEKFVQNALAVMVQASVCMIKTHIFVSIVKEKVYVNMEGNNTLVKNVKVLLSANMVSDVQHVTTAVVLWCVGVTQYHNVGISAPRNTTCTVRTVSRTCSRTIRVQLISDQNPKKSYGLTHYCNHRFWFATIGCTINHFMCRSTAVVVIRSVGSISGR